MVPYERFSSDEMRFGVGVGIRYVDEMRCVALKFEVMSERRVYNIPTDWHIRTMILNVQTWVKRDFISLMYVEEGDIDIFVIGERERLLEEERMTVKQKFENVYEITSFCVIQKVHECSICLQEKQMGCYFECRHRICGECNDSCVAMSHNRCPECRSARAVLV